MAAIDQAASTRSLVQPQSGALTTPRASPPTPTTSIAAPRRSGLSALSGLRCSRSSPGAGSIPIAIGRLTKNAQRQLVDWTSTPPREGPVAAATAPAAAQRLVAVARFSAGNASSTSPSDAGIRAAPPTAWITRAAINTAALGAAPEMTDPSRNRAKPTAKTRRRPTRSAIRPAGTSSAAMTTLYAFNTQLRSDSEVPANERRIAGNAMFTIVTSRNTMNTASEASSSTFHSRGMPRRPSRARGRCSGAAILLLLLSR